MSESLSSELNSRLVSDSPSLSTVNSFCMQSVGISYSGSLGMLIKCPSDPSRAVVIPSFLKPLPPSHDRFGYMPPHTIESRIHFTSAHGRLFKWALIRVDFVPQKLAHKRPWALIWVGAYSNEYGIFINSKKSLYICIYHPTIFIEFILC